MEGKKAEILKKIQDSQTMQAIREDVAKSTEFVATTTCMNCKKKFPLGQETCPECNATASNTVFSIVNAFLIVCFGMFFFLGFLKSGLWIYSIVSLFCYIVINKLKTRILHVLDRLCGKPGKVQEEIPKK